MRRDPIVIVAADPGWAASFERQRRRLTPPLADVLTRPIEHIGSTAVPGLPAKPIVDMLAVVTDHDRAAEVLPSLAGIGWVPAPEPGEAERRKLSACCPDLAHRTHHLHLVEAHSAQWPDWLLFRDHLRAHPEVAAEYAALKRRLADADAVDRPRYRAAKAPFIEQTLAAARRARDASG